MKQIITVALAGWMSLVALQQAALANDMLPEGIEVSGKASITAEPDRFSLSLSVVERNKSAQKAKLLVDHKSDLVVDAAKALKVPVSDIKSAQLSLRPIYRQVKRPVNEVELHKDVPGNNGARLHIDPPIEEDYQAVAFEVSRRITITLRQITDYDALLDSIVKIGVSNVSQLTMSISNADELYQQALQQAIMRAKQKATQMAGQAGVKLGSVIYLKELSYNAPSYRMAMPQNVSMEMSAGHASLPGSQDISAEVVARFAIAP